MEERGVIRNRQYATQIRDFSGLRYGNITPTDYDLVIEYKNLCWIYGELKFGDAVLPDGQRIAAERQCDDCQTVKPTLFIIATHNTDGDIDVAGTRVTKYRFKGNWVVPKKPITTKELIDRFIAWVEKEKRLRKG